MQMKRTKFTLGVNKRQQIRHRDPISLLSCTDAQCDDINNASCPRWELTSIASRMGVLMIHHGSPSIVSQHLLNAHGGETEERWRDEGEERWRRGEMEERRDGGETEER